MIRDELDSARESLEHVGRHLVELRYHDTLPVAACDALSDLRTAVARLADFVEGLANEMESR